MIPGNVAAALSLLALIAGVFLGGYRATWHYEYRDRLRADRFIRDLLSEREVEQR